MIVVSAHCGPSGSPELEESSAIVSAAVPSPLVPVLNAVVSEVPSRVEAVVGSADVEPPEVVVGSTEVVLAVVAPELAELAELASVTEEDDDDSVPPPAGSGSASAAQAAKRTPHPQTRAIDRIETTDAKVR